MAVISFVSAINRKISGPITKFLYKISPQINPNHITLIGAGIGIGAAACFYFGAGNPIWALGGGLLILISSIADFVDGEYARFLTSEQRPATARALGALLDTMSDRFIDVLIIFGMGTYLQAAFPDGAWIFPLTYATMAISLIASFSRHQILRACRSLEEAKAYTWSRFDLAGRDARLFIFFIGSIAEGASLFTKIPPGAVLAVGMSLVILSHLISLGNRFYRLTRYLHQV